MTAHQLLAEGRLTEAIEHLESELADHPDDVTRRTFLFELLGFAGDLGRAESVLGEIELLDSRPEAQVGLRAYREILRAERHRRALFEGDGSPQFFSEPPRSALLHLEALTQYRTGRLAEASDTLKRARAERRGRRGVAGGVPVDEIFDADDLLAPVLEVVTAAGYHWVAWEDVQFLFVPPPQHLRDLIWTPARLATMGGLLGEVYVMNLYLDSHRHPDPHVRLGRMTVWNDAGPGMMRGAGQKLFHAGGEPRTLLEIGEVQFECEKDEHRGSVPEPGDPIRS
jgi:type VI secretion system protein ImpE